MRKPTSIVCIVAVAMSVMLAVPSAEAAKKKKRVFKGPYACPCGAQVLGVGPGFRLGSGEGGIDLPHTSKEKYVSLELEDESGQPVFFQISQNVEGGDNIFETDVGSACGKTEEPLPIPQPGAPMTAFLYSGTCDTGLAIATGGTFTAIFSASP